MPQIVERKKMLYVRDDWEKLYSEPVEIRRYWPIGVHASTYPHLVGQSVEWAAGKGLCRTEAGLAIRLEYGEQTKHDMELLEERKAD